MHYSWAKRSLLGVPFPSSAAKAAPSHLGLVRIANLNIENFKFDQLDIDLNNLKTTTIKKPKVQETSSLKLLSCIFGNNNTSQFCNESFKKEIIPALNRRFILPFYIPVISLCCSLLLIKSKRKLFNQYSIFFYSFVILLFTELLIRYTGISKLILNIYLFAPLILLIYFYFLLSYQFKQEIKILWII